MYVDLSKYLYVNIYIQKKGYNNIKYILQKVGMPFGPRNMMSNFDAPRTIPTNKVRISQPFLIEQRLLDSKGPKKK